MRIPIILLALAFSGCLSSAVNMQKFLAKLPPTELKKVEHTFNAPLWSNTERVLKVTTDANGLLDIDSAYSEVKIPLWGVVNTFTIESFKQIAPLGQNAAIVAARPLPYPAPAAIVPPTAAKMSEAEAATRERQNLLRQAPTTRMEIGPSGQPYMATIHP